MSLTDSLKMIRTQTRRRSFGKILESLIADVTRGLFLSKSLEKFRATFGELFINIVKVGETSGTLPENLNYLALELKKRHELRGKVRGALIYPAIIFFVTIVIATTLIVFVFPKLLPLFRSLKVELPITTRLLIAVAGFLTNYGLWVILGLIVLIILFILLLRAQGFRKVVHRLAISLPLFGKIVVEVNLVNSSRTLGLLLKSGVRIVEAVNITADTLINLVYQRELKSAAEKVRKGEFISKHFVLKKKFFPAIFTNMVAVGENTGNLTENLNYLAEYYESEVDDFVKNLSGTLEPILLIFMGVLVGFIALSFITPLYKLTQGIR